MLFNMMQRQQAAAKRQFQIQLKEICQRSLEDCMQLTKFLADTQLHAKHSSSTDGGFSPEKLSQKFNRLDKVETL